MCRFFLTIALLAVASYASAQCNVQQGSASAAAAVQQQQVQALIQALQSQPTAASATAVAGNPAVAQQLALIQAQNRAAAASALAAPQVTVQGGCVGGSCGVARSRSVARTLARPVVVRPLRSRSVARSVSVSRG